jgi:hypothetical protein
MKKFISTYTKGVIDSLIDPDAQNTCKIKFAIFLARYNRYPFRIALSICIISMVYTGGDIVTLLTPAFYKPSLYYGALQLSLFLTSVIAVFPGYERYTFKLRKSQCEELFDLLKTETALTKRHELLATKHKLSPIYDPVLTEFTDRNSNFEYTEVIAHTGCASRFYIESPLELDKRTTLPTTFELCSVRP